MFIGILNINHKLTIFYITCLGFEVHRDEVLKQSHLLPGILRANLASVRDQKGLEDLASILLLRLDFASFEGSYSPAISAAWARYSLNSIRKLCHQEDYCESFPGFNFSTLQG